ncbi:glycerophosphodiester phosphodiesterase [Candidatus Woesearchaeota archaeon]|nr:glycerophosphodiester phosphodiesterase [Candidatus Woesearchaeota archaeon]
MIQTVGHRGAAALEPENTLRGFRKAIELGVDYVEFDIHRCKSGELVVIHDETVDRTTNGKGFVADLTLQQLKVLDAGKGEQIPTLQEAIDTCKGKVKMQIELKDPGLEKDVIDALTKNGIPEAIIISFFHEFVKIAKEQAAGKKIKIKTGVILAGNPINVVEMAKLANADYVTGNHFYMDEKMAKRVKEAGLGLTAWTCNTEHDIRKVIAFGADMIASDKPDLLVKVLGER